MHAPRLRVGELEGSFNLFLWALELKLLNCMSRARVVFC